METPEIFCDLEDLLDRERDMILKGDIGNLQRLLLRKQDLLTDLAASPPPNARDLTRIKGKADHNQLLLGSVAKGIRSVSERVAAMRSGQSTLSTYTSSGHRANVTTGNSSHIERRA